MAASSSISWTAVTPTGTTVSIEIALSTDNGATWTNWLPCTNGQAIPGIDELSSLQNVQIKIRETLTTSDVYVSPELQEVNIEIITAWGNVVYGPNKSTLTGWDSISLAWKPERLSLVVNDEEACYIENPVLPTAFGSHVYIGTDRNGNNAINTLVDELRIDKVYRDADTRVSWHKVKSPFYSSEEIQTVAAAQANLARIKAEAYADGIVTEEEQARIAQAESILAVANSKFNAPGYVIATDEGIKVFDAENALRVLVGSWVEDAIRKYGIRIIDGLIEASKIYGTSFQSGQKGATSYVRIGAGFEPIEIVDSGKLALNIYCVPSMGGMLQFYNTSLNDMAGQILPFNDSRGTGLEIHARGNSAFDKDLLITADETTIDSPTTVTTGNLWVDGTLYSGGKSNIEITENYGIRTLVVRESPDHKYIVEGIGEITNATCRIDIEPIFLECIEPNEAARWVIQLTPYAQASLWVSEIADTYFVVSSDIDQIEFAWTLSAYRKNFADIYLPEYVSKGVR